MKTLYADIVDSLDRFHAFQCEFREEMHPNIKASNSIDYFRFWRKKYTRASDLIIAIVKEPLRTQI